ncbi:hypothetical protein KM043_002187 [Ampulex compressa]|nr:hypothetical protein KM043_002187 [Ampulex compressa]
MRGFVAGGGGRDLWRPRYHAEEETLIAAAKSHDPIANSSMIHPKKNTRRCDRHETVTRQATPVTVFLRVQSQRQRRPSRSLLIYRLLLQNLSLRSTGKDYAAGYIATISRSANDSSVPDTPFPYDSPIGLNDQLGPPSV